jgi:hypothetical protein
MPFEVKKARRTAITPSILLMGASGSGKTYSALSLATGYGAKRPVLIDTENERSQYYADKFSFSVIALRAPYTVERYLNAARDALKEGADFLIVDQVTYEWNGNGGILQQVDESPASNSMAKWKEPSKKHSEFIDFFVHLKVPNIVCVRAKEQYIMEEQQGRDGKTKNVPRKIGLGPIQRDGFEYEFPLCFLIDDKHVAKPVKDMTGLFAVPERDDDGKLTYALREEMISEAYGRELAKWARGATPSKK